MKDTMTAAARDVLAERERQINKEGWTPERDDQYNTGELGDAAACYASVTMPAVLRRDRGGLVPRHWPWHISWWKPADRRRNLVKAGALVLAEIERIDRIPTPAEHVQNFLGALEQSRAARNHKE